MSKKTVIAALLGVGTLFTIFSNNEAVSGIPLIKSSKQTSRVSDRSSRLSRQEIEEAVARISREMETKQQALASGAITVDDYHRWLHQWSEENKDLIPHLNRYQASHQADPLLKAGIVHRRVTTPPSPERQAAEAELAELRQTQEESMQSIRHLAAQDVNAYQKALHQWDQEHGQAFREKRQDIIERMNAQPVETMTTIELPSNATEDMLKYKELCGERAAFFADIAKWRKENNATSTDWQLALQENEERIHQMTSEIHSLRQKIQTAQKFE